MNFKLYAFLISTLVGFSAFSQTMVCGVYLKDLKTSKVLAHKLMEQSLHGTSAGNFTGSDFFTEQVKKRFLRKPLVTSKIVFTDMLNVVPDSGVFQFFRMSKPNKYGILTQQEKLGEEITVRIGEIQNVIIDEQYSVQAYCNIKRS